MRASAGRARLFIDVTVRACGADRARRRRDGSGAPVAGTRPRPRRLAPLAARPSPAASPTPPAPASPLSGACPRPPLPPPG